MAIGDLLHTNVLQVPVLCAAPGSPKTKKSSIQHVALCPSDSL
jgi:hypothetical protein